MTRSAVLDDALNAHRVEACANSYHGKSWNSTAFKLLDRVRYCGHSLPVNERTSRNLMHPKAHNGGVTHTASQLTAWVKMCPKMVPHPKVLVCTYYGGEKGEPDEAAGSSR